VGKNTFWQFESSQSDFDSERICGIGFKPSAPHRTIGIGYRFRMRQRGKRVCGSGLRLQFGMKKACY
jgi:hypothetical protein